jgi:hypothetical protein
MQLKLYRAMKLQHVRIYPHHFVNQLKELRIRGARLLQTEVQRVLDQLLAAA